MRNILVTVMMIVVVMLLFHSIIADNGTGTRVRIQTQGTTATRRSAISRLSRIDGEDWRNEGNFGFDAALAYGTGYLQRCFRGCPAARARG